MNLINPRTCAIAYSVSILGDKWSLLILRDIILHKKSRFKEFKDSKEKIATNILSNRLKTLAEQGLIEKLDPTGTKKSTRYIATSKGLTALPIIIEMYLFSINAIDETILDASQINIKKEITTNRNLFEKSRIAEYLNFVQELRGTILGVQMP
ncbi:helix-turn-helix transcriptional regulator [Polaribacter sp.]|nr:helix-turn-helix transcriptional regulator [Polaribacter sp.]MDC1465739.1 helix-turn-helix transcriptional regulator [Polaribacter sp.]